MIIGDFVKDRNFLFEIGRLSRFDNVGLIGERGVNDAVQLLNSGSEDQFLATVRPTATQSRTQRVLFGVQF
jgi:hypothetical protein